MTENKNTSIILIGIVIAIIVFLGGAFVGNVMTKLSIYNGPGKMSGNNLEFVGKQDGAYTYKVCAHQGNLTGNNSLGNFSNEGCPMRNQVNPDCPYK